MKSIGIINLNQEGLTKEIENLLNNEIIFRKIRRDAVGKSASNPTWGYAYEVQSRKMKWKGEGLYKEYDNDAPYASYAEKIASIVYMRMLSNARVPSVDIVGTSKNEPSIISYKVLDNNKEDMFHIRDILFNIMDREELKSKKSIYSVKDILDSIRVQIQDDRNYEEIQKSLLETLMLDSIMNNGDRHANNWAVVRDKKTNWYELAIFDHSSTFTDMLHDQRHYTCNGWVTSYIKVKEEKTKIRTGSLGNEIIQFICENYGEIFNGVTERFNEKLPYIIEEIKKENLPIDINRLEKKLYERKNYLNNIRNREGER